MNIVNIHDLPDTTGLISVDDVAMYPNLTYHSLVEELLEVFTDFTDFDLIAEIVDTENLNYTCVVEQSHEGLLVHGYIKGGVPA